MRLDESRASRALAALGQQAGLSATEAALGVVEVANAHMERALRVISVERGHDPRDFTLISFGGAGGLHAADLARRLGITRVLVPPQASTLSAFGMLAADVVKDYSQTVMLEGDTPSGTLDERLRPLAERALREVMDEGIARGQVSVEGSLDVRYRGQSYELTVRLSGDTLADFHEAHRRAFGYARPGAPVEIVNVRVRATGRVEPPPLPRLPAGGPDATPALLERRPVTLGPGHTPLVPLYRAEALRAGNRFAGPALVVRADTTILVGEADEAEVDAFGNLLIAVRGMGTG
jgi:N-methylhydantoinase A